MVLFQLANANQWCCLSMRCAVSSLIWLVAAQLNMWLQAIVMGCNSLSRPELQHTDVCFLELWRQPIELMMLMVWGTSIRPISWVICYNFFLMPAKYGLFSRLIYLRQANLILWLQSIRICIQCPLHYFSDSFEERFLTLPQNMLYNRLPISYNRWN